MRRLREAPASGKDQNFHDRILPHRTGVERRRTAHGRGPSRPHPAPVVRTDRSSCRVPQGLPIYTKGAAGDCLCASLKRTAAIPRGVAGRDPATAHQLMEDPGIRSAVLATDPRTPGAHRSRAPRPRPRPSGSDSQAVACRSPFGRPSVADARDHRSPDARSEYRGRRAGVQLGSRGRFARVRAAVKRGMRHRASQRPAFGTLDDDQQGRRLCGARARRRPSPHLPRCRPERAKRGRRQCPGQPVPVLSGEQLLLTLGGQPRCRRTLRHVIGLRRHPGPGHSAFPDPTPLLPAGVSAGRGHHDGGDRTDQFQGDPPCLGGPSP